MMSMSNSSRVSHICRRILWEEKYALSRWATGKKFVSTHRQSFLQGAVANAASMRAFTIRMLPMTADKIRRHPATASNHFPIVLHNRLQFRYFDQRKKRKPPTKKKANPFKVLNIPEGATLYKDAKKKFLQIAMKNHPDTISGDVSDKKREEMRDIFIHARIAFEELVEDPSDGMAILAEDLDEAMDNFDSWFKSETGFSTPFQFDMDAATMKEVANMTEKLGEGLDRDGGMWALARMVTASVKSGSDAGTPLRLEAGDAKGRAVTGSMRRRRKR